MHDAHAAFAFPYRFGQEARDFLVRFVPVEAVQVDVVADRPAAPAQVAQHTARQAGAQKDVGLADGQQVVDLERSMQ